MKNGNGICVLAAIVLAILAQNYLLIFVNSVPAASISHEHKIAGCFENMGLLCNYIVISFIFKN
jgi:hypothetical protein